MGWKNIFVSGYGVVIIISFLEEVWINILI